MNKRFLFLIGFCFFIIFLNIISATLNVSLSDQGTDVKDKSTGNILTSGDLSITIYDALSGGNLIYNETFVGAIVNGSWNVMLGENSSNPLSLEFGKIYYKDYAIDGSDLDFINFQGNTVERQFFYSPLGDIAGEDISSSANLTISGLNLTEGNITNVNTGFFNWLGSLANEITKLFVTDIDAVNIETSGNIGVGGDLNVTGKIYGDASVLNVNNSNYLEGYNSSFFMPLNTSIYGSFDFNGGWLNNGLSIIGGDIYAQTAYFYNITSLNVTQQNLTVIENLIVGGNLTANYGLLTNLYDTDASNFFDGTCTTTEGVQSISSTGAITCQALNVNDAIYSGATFTTVCSGCVGADEIATSGVATAEILDNTVQAIDLEATNAEADNDILTYDSATGGFTFNSCSEITGLGATLCDGSDAYAANTDYCSGGTCTAPLATAQTAAKCTSSTCADSIATCTNVYGCSHDSISGAGTYDTCAEIDNCAFAQLYFGANDYIDWDDTNNYMEFYGDGVKRGANLLGKGFYDTDLGWIDLTGITAGNAITVTGTSGSPTVAVTAGSIDDNEIVQNSIDGSEITNDILDFVDFQDTLDLDASTQINVGTGENFYIDLDGTADFIIRDVTTIMAQFLDTGDIQLGNNNELYVDTSAGRVGIGDSSPSYTLDVSGTARVTGVLLAEGSKVVTFDLLDALHNPTVSTAYTTPGSYDLTLNTAYDYALFMSYGGGGAGGSVDYPNAGSTGGAGGSSGVKTSDGASWIVEAQGGRGGLGNPSSQRIGAAAAIPTGGSGGSLAGQPTAAAGSTPAAYDGRGGYGAGTSTLSHVGAAGSRVVVAVDTSHIAANTAYQENGHGYAGNSPAGGGSGAGYDHTTYYAGAGGGTSGQLRVWAVRITGQSYDVVVGSGGPYLSGGMDRWGGVGSNGAVYLYYA